MNATPPLPPKIRAPSGQKSRSGRGCLFAAIATVVVMPLLGYGVLSWLAHLYEKSPKQPGEAEFMEVHTRLVGSYKGKEGMGNSATAEEMAREFARELRLGRHVFFTEGSKSLLSLTEGHFLTFCSLVSNRCAFIIHVPQLRNYVPEAKVTLGELAWVIATKHVQSKTNLNIQELAVAIQGVMDIDRILIGKIDTARKPLENCVEKTAPVKDEILYRFFDWPKQKPADPGGGTTNESQTR